MSLDPESGTIFFVHSGPLRPYVLASILQARAANPRVEIVVLGDQHRAAIPPSLSSQFHYTYLNEYSARASDFAKIFRFDGDNSYDYELLNFQRWFYIHSFCEANSIGGPFLMLDSDAYLYLSLHEVVSNLESPMTVVDRVGPQFTFFLSFDAITQFTSFLSDSFSSDSGFRRLSDFVDSWGGVGLPHVSDMAALGSYAIEHRVEDIGIADRRDFIFCENIGSAQGLTMSLLGKRVTFRNKRRFFTTQDGRKLLAGGIHLQGKNKVLWPFFVDNSVKRAIRDASPRGYTVARRQAAAKALGIVVMRLPSLLRRLSSSHTDPSN